MSSERVWIAGASGMLGHALVDALRRKGAHCLATGHELDISSFAAVDEFVRRERPTVIVNAAAYTRVDAAETHPEECYATNERGAACLARAALESSCPFLHVSTDYVFDGESQIAYTEDMPCAPRGVYAKSKRAGELAVLATAAQNPAGVFIVRTSWLFGEHGTNFVTTMLRLLRERELLRVVDDQHGRPTYTPDLAEAIVDLLGMGSTPRAHPDVYHFANTGATTWHGLASAVFETARSAGVVVSAKEIVPIPSSEYPVPAPRPRFSVLDTSRIALTLGREPRPWLEAVREFMSTSLSKS